MSRLFQGSIACSLMLIAAGILTLTFHAADIVGALGRCIP